MTYNKLDILYLASQMEDISRDIDYLIDAINDKQITKKELKKSLKCLIKHHRLKTAKITNALNSYFSDSTY